MKKFIILFFFLFSSVYFGQNNRTTVLSGGIGYGSITSNSPEIGTLAFHLSASHKVSFLPFNLKVDYCYQRESEYFLPMSETLKLYYSYLQLVNIGVELFQSAGENISFSEFFGYSIVNDRVFEGINNWANGIMFSAEIGLFRTTSPFWLSVGFKYGLTFDENKPSSGDFFLKANYSLDKI